MASFYIPLPTWIITQTFYSSNHTSFNFWIKPPFYCDYGYNIYIDKNVMFNYACVILDVCPVRIGEHTMIGPNTHIYTSCHSLDSNERLLDVEFGKPVTIGKNVWIGGNCTILPGGYNWRQCSHRGRKCSNKGYS